MTNELECIHYEHSKELQSHIYRNLRSNSSET
jgi:hypothetical protein